MDRLAFISRSVTVTRRLATQGTPHGERGSEGFDRGSDGAGAAARSPQDGAPRAVGGHPREEKSEKIPCEKYPVAHAAAGAYSGSGGASARSVSRGGDGAPPHERDADAAGRRRAAEGIAGGGAAAGKEPTAAAAAAGGSGDSAPRPQQPKPKLTSKQRSSLNQVSPPS
jgi:hypothetical protein